jgi:dTDP-glucose 4,6-dehydratase
MTKATVITGGAGFIGSHLCEHLLQRNDRQVVCVDNLVTGHTRNLQAFRNNEQFRFVDHDLSEPLFLDDFDVAEIYHLASPASPKDYLDHPIHTLKVGAMGTYHMLGMAKDQDARFLLASTSEVYGDPEEHPQTETYTGNVDPVGPRGVYDESKRYAEAITMAYHTEHGVETRIARIFNTYGPRMQTDDGRVIPNFLRQGLKDEPMTVYGHGSQTRSFCYISDMVDGLATLMEQGDEHPTNLGNPREVTILELAEILQDLTGSEAGITHEPLPEDDPQRRKPSIDRARDQLDWQPSVDLRDGLRWTMRDFREVLGVPT